MHFTTSAGRPYPFGATVSEAGTNFAVFSRHATAVFLELFRHSDDPHPEATIALNPERNRTGDVWHVFVHDVGHGRHYGYRVDGPYRPEELGHRFNVNKLLGDPYARGLAGSYRLDRDEVYGYDRTSPRADLSFSEADSAPYTVKSVVLGGPFRASARPGDPTPFDWEGDRPPRRPLEQTVIEEVHVKGLTCHPSAAVSCGGTYLGLIEKIPHFLELGVSALELLPVHEFNEGEPIGVDPVTGAQLTNFWGYQSLGFFAPEISYSCSRAPGGPTFEFQEMVKQLHRAGIEVILDVVFNHSGEGDERGPTLSFRGLDNSVYYILDANRRYKNYSGTGNTMKCYHPVVKQFILDCLRYWVVEMHVDGFRFDLATILGRGRKGEWVGDLSLLHDIGGDPILRGCKLIAESWDAEGLYKVGGFPSGWAEWNGRFRDDVRRFVRGDSGMVPQLARRIGGSLDLFARKPSPAASVNFITCHDGFTLRDLVSYATKHNERNGEDNRDGAAENFSSNWGVEGETDDEGVRARRLRVARNLLSILLVSRGTPMLLGGDELWHTKQGNNNTYCQDNELSWLSWDLDDDARALQRFIRMLVALRRRHPALRRPCFVDPFAVDGAGVAGPVGDDITWHGVRPGQPDWSYHSRTLALHVHGEAPDTAVDSADDDLFVILSAWTMPLEFALPPLPPPRRWHRVVDTSLPSPEDIVEDHDAPRIEGSAYRCPAQTAIVLLGR